MEQKLEQKPKFIVNEEEYQNFKKGPSLSIEGRFISVALIQSIFTNDDLFAYTKSFFEEKYSSFYICLNDLQYLSYNRLILIKAIEETFKKGYLSDAYQDKYMTLKDMVSPRALLRKYNNDVFCITIDNNKYEIPARFFLDFLFLDDNLYNNVINSSDSTIFNIPKEKFIYALVSFIKEEEIITKYELDAKFKRRFMNLSYSEVIDIQALNRFNQPTDVLHTQVNINPSLKDAITKDMPDNLSLLEKAIYIYLKMCLILSYDDEYLVGEKGTITRNHSDMAYISSITPDNPKIVCYEFNIIYARLLSELGIIFKSTYSNSNKENYGDAHVFLEYRIDNLLLKADSCKTILQNDMARVKMGLAPKGIECVNNNEKSKAFYQNILAKMHSLVLKVAGKENIEVSFARLVQEYKSIHDSIEVSLEEKLDIMLSKVNDASLLGIDALSYILVLKNIIFNGYETNNNFFYVVVKSKLDPVDKQNSMASAVFIINTLGISEDQSATRYFYYAPGMPLKEMSKEELEYDFNEGSLAYIETGSPAIPGINYGGKR